MTARPYAPGDDLHARCASVQHALPPEAVFTHLTSAALRGWRIPAMTRLPIIATTSADAPHHDRRGVYVRRCAVPDDHRQVAGGLRVASAEWTVAELAEDLALIDLVAVIDGVLHVGDTTVERLADMTLPGRRGSATLREALVHVDGSSESWWESVLRMAHRLAGIQVDTQVVLVDGHGDFVARTDLQIVGTVRHPEYDGPTHRDKLRSHRDLRRDQDLARLGGQRVGYSAEEILATPTLVLRDAEDALGLPHDPGRWADWLHELERSSVSRPGRAALDARLQRYDRRMSPRSRKAAS